jgi:Tfp pilus assembly protein PilN
MGQFDLNLSTRPFKPYRAANFGLLVLLLALIAVSAGQVLSYQQYSSLADVSRQVEQEVRMSNDELTTEVQKLNAKMASGNATAKLSEVELLNRLLVRKSFSWTTVFANLERVMPDDVRLLSLAPFVDEKGQIGLSMAIRGRTLSDATAFLRTLEDSDIFTDVSLAIQEKKDLNPSGEVQFTLTAYYTPPEPKASSKLPSNAQSKVVK